LIVEIAKQLFGIVYVTIDVPAVTPVIIPVADPAVILLLLLVHIPPPASDKVIVAPVHTEVGPEIDEGEVLTVTISEVAHPLLRV
jgi:hypothetical protein